MRDRRAMRNDGTAPAYVVGDWGTSRLRLFLLLNGAVADTCEGPGIGALATAPVRTRVETLAGLLARWMKKTQPIEVLLSGMAGSRNGLREVPYVALPAVRAAWSRAVGTLREQDMHISIAAGLRGGDAGTGADVMRGEETQIFGALELDPALGSGTHVFLLPGTHSKWVEVADGSITRFRTAVTGELHALLRDQSTLLKTDTVAAISSIAKNSAWEAGFGAGVDRAVNPGGNLLASLFETRAAQLIDARSRSWAAGFLSGLLIGAEVSGMSEAFRPSDEIRIVGDSNLVSLYQSVLSTLSIESLALDGTACVIAGLGCLRSHLAVH